MFIVQFFAYLTCYLKTEENKYLYMYLATFVLIILLMGAYRLVLQQDVRAHNQ